MSKKWGKYFGHFSVFYELRTAFWSVFRYRSKKAKHKKVVPGIILNFCDSSKNPSVHIWVPIMRFPKMYIFGAPIESTEPRMVSS